MRPIRLAPTLGIEILRITRNAALDYPSDEWRLSLRQVIRVHTPGIPDLGFAPLRS